MQSPTQLNAAEARARQLMAADPEMSIREAARQAGIGFSTLHGRLEKNPAAGANSQTAFTADEPGVQEAGDGSATISGEPSQNPEYPWTPATLLEAHGIVAAEWEIISVRVNRWGSPDGPMQQLRVNAIRKANLLQLPGPVEFDLPPGSGIEEYSGEGCVAFVSDHHAPYHSEPFHRAFCSFLKAEQPAKIVILGDAADNSIISRHRTHPRFAAEINRTNDAVVRIFYDYRRCCPDAEIILLPGNHDDRVGYALQDYKPELYGARAGTLPGESEDIPVMNFRRLWRLDELNITLVDDDWKIASYPVTPSLTARHGYLTGNNSERKLLEKHGRSQVHGHDHRLSMIFRTKHDPLDVRVAMSCGTAAEVEPDGLGYEPDPDWQQGCGVGYIWEDGFFALAPAPFIQGSLLLPDGRRFYADEA